jgi:polyisoprenoid-binding protein YceI
MKTIRLLTIIMVLLATAISYGQNSDKLVSSKTHIKFFSTTVAEDIEANNYTSVSTINKETGDVVFSVPMQGFEFEKSLMQKHYNSKNFLDTKTYPKAKLKAKIINIDEVDFNKDGVYNAIIEGEMTMKGVTKKVKEKGAVTVKGDKVIVKSKFNITLANYGVEFLKGKPSSNIAKTLEITVLSEY